MAVVRYGCVMKLRLAVDCLGFIGLEYLGLFAAIALLVANSTFSEPHILILH